MRIMKTVKMGGKNTNSKGIKRRQKGEIQQEEEEEK